MYNIYIISWRTWPNKNVITNNQPKQKYLNIKGAYHLQVHVVIKTELVLYTKYFPLKEPVLEQGSLKFQGPTDEKQCK